MGRRVALECYGKAPPHTPLLAQSSTGLAKEVFVDLAALAATPGGGATTTISTRLKRMSELQQFLYLTLQVRWWCMCVRARSWTDAGSHCAAFVLQYSAAVHKTGQRQS